MSDRSRIEWTDASWNPVRGCTRISPGCTHCYAETFAERFRGVAGHPYEQGFDLRLVPEKLTEPLRWRTPRRILVNSMSDLFHEGVPEEFIVSVVRVMQAANWHTYQVLTKRSTRMRDLLSTSLRFAGELPHVWWGVSVENRRHGLPRIEHLRGAPVPVRFLSVEPLLESLGEVNLQGIAWVIVGGESGHGARPIDPSWVRALRDQCEAAGIPFFFKQWGGGNKKQTGRELDGKTYDAMPATFSCPAPANRVRLRLIEEFDAQPPCWGEEPPVPAESLYADREQSLVKHFILQRYLCDFAHKVGFGWDTITYVDCFSGPWSVRSADLTDSSFSIALNELRKARATLAEHRRQLRIRCFFLEKNPEAYGHLARFAGEVNDAEVRTQNKTLTEARDDILAFIRAGGRGAFPFLFIDPTGWSGLNLETIQPLLRETPSEVLINFMTDYIRRFVESPKEETVDSFDRFFGCTGVRDHILSIDDPQEREDELFLTYARQVQRAGRYDYSCAAIVLYPQVERCYFHLVYATRNPTGVEVFKRVEQKAMGVMEQARAQARQRQQVERTGQRDLFRPEQLHHARRLTELRRRYLDQARRQAEARMQGGSPVLYDCLWAEAMSWPLVWDVDVKDWIAEWQRQGALEVQGLKPRQRVPRLGGANRLIWKQGPPAQRSLFEP
jgi:three-Cys-motif partner protein